MENRIKIGDVWYVKEDQTLISVKAKVKPEIIYSKEMQIDAWGNQYSLVASCLTDEKYSGYKMVSIDVKSIDHKEIIEFMDNEEFLLGVANRDLKSIAELNDSSYTDDSLEAIIVLCDKMKELKWI